MCLVLFMGSVRALLSFLSSYTYPVPENSCDWSPGLSSSLSSCLGTRVTSVGVYNIFLSLLAWCELCYCTPCEACRYLCHFCKVCRKCGDRNSSHSCYNESVQGSPQGPICWSCTWAQESYFNLFGTASFCASTQVAFLPHPTICVNNWGQQGVGKTSDEDSFFCQ